ncbi:MAG: AraC family transcriptional regulator [Chitinophagales bacterium]
MKILQFTIPVSHDKSIIIKKDVLPYFYPYLHRHDEIQLTWVQKGEGTIVVDSNMHAFRSNEIYWVGANRPHILKSDISYFAAKSKKRCSSLTLFFNPSGKLAPFFDLPEMKNIRDFLFRCNSGAKIPDEKVAEFSNKMLCIKNTTGVEQLTHFIDLLHALSKLKNLEILSYSKPLPYSESDGIRIGSLYNYIMHNYSKPISLNDAAMQVHMTPHAFCRYFKKHTLHTFLSFLNEVRINEACKMLTEGSQEGIAGVAYNCGFNSVTNFNRVFKSIIGKSPSNYLTDYYKM